VFAQTAERVGRTFDSWGENQRLRQVGEIRFGWVDVTQGAQPIKRIPFREWREQSHWAAPISDLDRLSLFDATKQFTRSLSKFPDADRSHVLLIARIDRRVLGSDAPRVT
jgi:hypothetical protein